MAMPEPVSHKLVTAFLDRGEHSSHADIAAYETLGRVAMFEELQAKGWKFIPPPDDHVVLYLTEELAEVLDDFLFRLAPGTQWEEKKLLRQLINNALDRNGPREPSGTLWEYAERRAEDD